MVESMCLAFCPTGAPGENGALGGSSHHLRCCPTLLITVVQVLPIGYLILYYLPLLAELLGVWQFAATSLDTLRTCQNMSEQPPEGIEHPQMMCETYDTLLLFGFSRFVQALPILYMTPLGSAMIWSHRRRL